MKEKAGLLPFTAGGLALSCFLLVAGVMATAVQPLWGRTLVLLLPALVFFAVGAAARKGSLSPRAAAVLTAVLAAVFFFLSLCYVFLLSIWTATTVTTEVKYYTRALAQIDSNEEAGVQFGAPVAEGARDVDCT